MLVSLIKTWLTRFLGVFVLWFVIFAIERHHILYSPVMLVGGLCCLLYKANKSGKSELSQAVEPVWLFFIIIMWFGISLKITLLLALPAPSIFIIFLIGGFGASFLLKHFEKPDNSQLDNFPIDAIKKVKTCERSDSDKV